MFRQSVTWLAQAVSYACKTCRLLICTGSFLFLAQSSHSIHPSEPEPFILPNLAKLLRVAISDGYITPLVGTRHYTGAPVLTWDHLYPPSSPVSIFHAYGFGGSGLTLAPAVAEHIVSKIKPRIDETGKGSGREVVVFGAGYIGILTALELVQFLESRGDTETTVKVVSYAFPRDITTLKADFREPELQDNYISQVAGGWIMPVSIQPLEDRETWCSLVKRAQEKWQGYTTQSPLKQAVHMTQSLVFHDSSPNIENLREDKSGIRTVNNTCPFVLYPETPFTLPLYTQTLLPEQNNHSLAPIPFKEAVRFDNVVQADTVSVLKHFTSELLKSRAKLIQTDAPIKSYSELQRFLNPEKSSIIINASGHGAKLVFPHVTESRPIRGDLVVLRLPVSKLDETTRHQSRYSFWAGGSHYVFMRYSLDRQWMEVVLGGTFIEKDRDLSIRLNSVKSILLFWLRFFHRDADQNSTEMDSLIHDVIKHTQRTSYSAP